MKITKPELKFVRFNAEDVIATSLFAVADGDNYTVYSGGIITRTPAANGGLPIAIDATPLYSWTQAEYDENKNNILFSPLYNAYYESGNYYTNGVPFDANTTQVGGQDPVNTPGTPPSIPGWG